MKLKIFTSKAYYGVSIVKTSEVFTPEKVTKEVDWLALEARPLLETELSPVCISNRLTSVNYKPCFDLTLSLQCY